MQGEAVKLDASRLTTTLMISLLLQKNVKGLA